MSLDSLSPRAPINKWDANAQQLPYETERLLNLLKSLQVWQERPRQIVNSTNQTKPVVFRWNWESPDQRKLIEFVVKWEGKADPSTTCQKAKRWLTFEAKGAKRIVIEDQADCQVVKIKMQKTTDFSTSILPQLFTGMSRTNVEEQPP